MARFGTVTLALAATLILSGSALAQRQQPTAPKVQVIQPAAGDTLTGAVSVRVKITAPENVSLPSTVFVGLGGRPWTGLERDGGGSEWTGSIDSAMVPNGAEKLLVLTNNKRARAELDVTVGNPLRYFFADLHSHTAYSDGTLLPAIAHDYARDTAELDVFSLTDHLEKVDDEEWLDTRDTALEANDPDQFVVIPGLEWTKKWGHVNIFDPKTRHWPEDPAEFYRAAAEAGVILKFNHPGDGTESHDGLAYSEVGDQAMQMMEVRRVTEEQAFIRALDLGWHLAPDGSDDTHSPNWGNAGRWTVILAPGLSQRCIWDAMAKRHLFATLDRNCLMSFTVNGAVMGDIIEEPAKAVQVVVAVDEADDADRIAKIELFEDGKIVATDEPNATNRKWETTRTPDPGEHYYFAKVTQADGNLIWSAPVWVTVEAR